MEAFKELSFDLPILCLKTLKGKNLGAIDSQNALRIVDTDTLAVLDGFKTNIAHTRLIESRVDMTDDGEFTVSAVSDTNQAAVFSLSKRQFLYQVGRHQGEVESVAIDPNGAYFVTSGQEGKSFVWVLKTKRLAFSLPRHSGPVSEVTFNENGQWIATGGNDAMIYATSLATLKHSLKLHGHTAPIIKIIFLPSAKILSVARNGEVFVWDMRNAKTIKALPKMFEEVSSVCISSSKRFVFVATKRGEVGLYDMNTMELVSSAYLREAEAIVSLAYIANPGRLAVGTVRGKIRFYLLLGDEERYMRMLEKKEYKLFYDAIDNNPMMRYSKAYEEAERIWRDLVEQGRKLLEINQRRKAVELFKAFAGIAKKEAFVSQMLSCYEQYGLFQEHVQEGRFALAYSLAKQYPAFQESELYRTMEAKWKATFYKAQELILQPGGEDQARELLSAYRGISEKTASIQQLFEQRRMYDLFKNILSKHEYVKFFALVKMYPFLKEFEEYSSVTAYGERLFMQAQSAYGSGDYATARKACEILVAFPDYAREAQEMSDTIRVKRLFFEALANNNLPSAFSYIAAYPLLSDTAEAQILERQWNQAVDKAQRFAAEGNARDAAVVFEPYFGVKERLSAIAGVMAQAYCVQLEHKIRYDADQELIERGFRKYVLVFGIDEGLREVFDLYKRVYRTKTELESLKQGSLEGWTPAIRIEDITAR